MPREGVDFYQSGDWSSEVDTYLPIRRLACPGDQVLEQAFEFAPLYACMIICMRSLGKRSDGSKTLRLSPFHSCHLPAGHRGDGGYRQDAGATDLHWGCRQDAGATDIHKCGGLQVPDLAVLSLSANSFCLS